MLYKRHFQPRLLKKVDPTKVKSQPFNPFFVGFSGSKVTKLGDLKDFHPPASSKGEAFGCMSATTITHPLCWI
jgi:hypothetical protein